ncbi:MAG: diguanylate cyclase [Burkholderiaceae bacterium]|nr:diguanylate cyclase [Burkholderiaceae bacterium]
MTQTAQDMDAEVWFDLSRNVLKAVNIGVAVLDDQQTFTIWNQWMERHSSVLAKDAIGKRLTVLFPELENSRLHGAVQNALESRLPALLSQTLNKAPFPLFVTPKDAREGHRMQQAIQVIPITAPGMPTHCLIQITDVSLAVNREAILRQQAIELRSKMHSDGLTGIPNRRRFDEHAEESYRLAARNGQPISLIMIDIDFFKQYNDHYGHLQGDQCLIEVATALSRAIKRPMDLVARYGGEEFVVVLPDTDGEGAMKIATDMRSNIEQLGIEHAQSAVSNHATISIGIATHTPTRDAGKLHDLISQADEALYEAKHSGRNRFVCHADLPPSSDTY